MTVCRNPKHQVFIPLSGKVIILHCLTNTIDMNFHLSLRASVADFQRTKLDVRRHFGFHGCLDVPVGLVQSTNCCVVAVVGLIYKDWCCQDVRFDCALSWWVEKKDCSLKTLFHHCTINEMERWIFVERIPAGKIAEKAIWRSVFWLPYRGKKCRGKVTKILRGWRNLPPTNFSPDILSPDQNFYPIF